MVITVTIESGNMTVTASTFNVLQTTLYTPHVIGPGLFTPEIISPPLGAYNNCCHWYIECCNTRKCVRVTEAVFENGTKKVIFVSTKLLIAVIYRTLLCIE